jgi:outer membrane protein assembly factor BamD (BamD/ComL family)
VTSTGASRVTPAASVVAAAGFVAAAVGFVAAAVGFVAAAAVAAAGFSAVAAAVVGASLAEFPAAFSAALAATAPLANAALAAINKARMERFFFMCIAGCRRAADNGAKRKLQKTFSTIPPRCQSCRTSACAGAGCLPRHLCESSIFFATPPQHLNTVNAMSSTHASFAKLHRASLRLAFSGVFLAAAAALPFDVPGLAPATAHAQAASQKKDRRVELADAAEKLFSRGGTTPNGVKALKGAYKNYETLLKEFGDGDQLPPAAKGLCYFRMASCALVLAEATEKSEEKDALLADAEKQLREFIKVPDGTGAFLSTTNNYHIVGKTVLGEILGKQKKFEEAVKLLDSVRKDPRGTKEEHVRAEIQITRVREDEVSDKSEEQKKKFYQTAVDHLKPLIARRDYFESYVKDAAVRLVEIYTKMGETKLARELNESIKAGASGKPVDVVMANFRRFEIGDTLFGQAESENAEDAKEKRNRLYSEALIAYQETMRMKSLSLLFDAAIQEKENEVAKARKEAAKDPKNEDSQAAVTKADAELSAFKETIEKFRTNKDYDAFISYRIALCLLELDRPWEAHVAFRDVFDNAPKFSKMNVAHFYYIKTLRAMHDNVEALKYCNLYIKKYPNAEQLGEVAVMSGEILYDQGEFDAAVKQFHSVRESVKTLSLEYKEWIDWYVCSAYFQSVEWEKAEAAIAKFLGNYPKSTNKEQMVYLRALCWFYLGKYGETRTAFGGPEGYITLYPKGQFIPDARYRMALVKFGDKVKPDNDGVIEECQNWLKDYAAPPPAIAGDIKKQKPEIYTLLGDVYFRKFDDKKSRDNEETRKKHLEEAIKYYIEAAKSARGNPQTIQFVTMELNRRLPSLNEWGKMLDIYTTFYEWDKDDPEALGYLYWILRSVDKLGKLTPDEIRRAGLDPAREAQAQAKYWEELQKAEAAKNKGEVEKVTVLINRMNEETEAKKRALRIQKAEEAIRASGLDPQKFKEYYSRDDIEIFAGEIKRNIDNPAKENVEQLIGELVRRAVLKYTLNARNQTALLREIEESKVRPENDRRKVEYEAAVAEAVKNKEERKEYTYPKGYPNGPELLQPAAVKPVPPADATAYVLRVLTPAPKPAAADAAASETEAAPRAILKPLADARIKFARASVAKEQMQAWERLRRQTASAIRACDNEIAEAQRKLTENAKDDKATEIQQKIIAAEKLRNEKKTEQNAWDLKLASLEDTHKQNLLSISRTEPQELSASLVSTLIDFLVAQKDFEKVEVFAQYMLTYMRGSTYLDFAFVAKAEILLARASRTLDEKNARATSLEALDLLREANDLDIVYNKEREFNLLLARAYLANLPGPMVTVYIDKDGKRLPKGKTTADVPTAKVEKIDRNLDEARAVLLTIAATKAWRGEPTAWALFYLGQIEEKRGHTNEAINYYNRCRFAWKKYGTVTAKAYDRAIELYIRLAKINPKFKVNVGLTIHQMLNDEAVAKAPETARARALQTQYPYTPQPIAEPEPATAAPAAAGATTAAR